jgi:HD-GYP domain-containing protein (c-di-GMP phosphodiesterase class II)
VIAASLLTAAAELTMVDLLAEDAARQGHSRGVAARAAGLASYPSYEDAETLVAAAYLHDIGRSR